MEGWEPHDGEPAEGPFLGFHRLDGLQYLAELPRLRNSLEAVSEFGIEVLYAPLDAALSTEILAAQGLQVMTNVTNLGT